MDNMIPIDSLKKLIQEVHGNTQTMSVAAVAEHLETLIKEHKPKPMNKHLEQRYYAYFTPRLFTDGDKWCALYGADLQVGIAGFGDTPHDALVDFESNFYTQKPPVEKTNNT